MSGSRAKSIRREVSRRGQDRKVYRRAKKLYYTLSPKDKKRLCQA